MCSRWRQLGNLTRVRALRHLLSAHGLRWQTCIGGNSGGGFTCSSASSWWSTRAARGWLLQFNLIFVMIVSCNGFFGGGCIGSGIDSTSTLGFYNVSPHVATGPCALSPASCILAWGLCSTRNAGRGAPPGPHGSDDSGFTCVDGGLAVLHQAWLATPHVRPRNGGLKL